MIEDLASDWIMADITNLEANVLLLLSELKSKTLKMPSGTCDSSVTKCFPDKKFKLH